MASLSSLARRAAALVLGSGAVAHVSVQAQGPAPRLRMGAVIPITGGASALGVRAANAIKILEERYAADKNLPCRVRIVTHDDATDPSKASSHAARNGIRS